MVRRNRTRTRTRTLTLPQDGGEAGTFHPSANSSVCLDSTVTHTPPLRLVACVQDRASQTWRYSSVTGALSSTTTQPCIVRSCQHAAGAGHSDCARSPLALPYRGTTPPALSHV